MNRHHSPRSTRMRNWRRAVLVAALGLTAVWSQPSPSLAAPDGVFDDFEDGDTSDWGFFGGNSAGGGGGPATDRPAQGATYFSTGWGGEGSASGFYGGAFRNVDNAAQVTLPADAWFNIWVYIQSDSTVDAFDFEVTLREDTNGDGWTDGSEDSVGLNTTFTSSEFDDQWRLISAPVASFFDRGTGGNGVFDGAVDEFVMVFGGVQGDPASTIEFDVDDITFTAGPPTAADTVIDDFENGLPNGAASPNGEPLGFYTFQGAGSGIGIGTEATPPAPELPAVGTPNNVLTMNIDSTSFAGYIHAFENDAVDTWVPQDWSTSEGISFWFDGNNSGAGMFIDILDNRTAASTTDDAERWTVAFTDDFDGWKLYELPFSGFARKEIGNGAPNDGLGLFEMHGYAFGALGTGGPQTFYFDQVALYGVAEPPALAAQFSINNTLIPEGTTGEVAVKLTRPMGPDDPAEVSIDYVTEVGNAVPGEDYTPTSGTLTFVNGGANELTFPVDTFDNTKFTGDKRVVVRLINPVDVERGALFQGSVLIQDDDPFDPNLRDDIEQGTENQWTTAGAVDIAAQRIVIGTADERPGQDVVENVLAATVTDAGVDAAAVVAAVIVDLDALLATASVGDTIRITNAIGRLEAAIEPGIFVDGALTANSGALFIGRAAQATTTLLRVLSYGRPEAAGARAAIDQLVELTGQIAGDAVALAQADGSDPRRVASALTKLAVAEQRLAQGRPDAAIRNHRGAWKDAVQAFPGAVDIAGEAATVIRDFPLGQDWTGTDSIDLWFQGTGSGDEVTVTLKNNRAPDPGPAGWNMVWSDEFDGAAGAPPNPANWTHEVGDVTPDGKNGWGNEELQYYTDDPSNSATDGNGNLVITLDEADSGRECYYGPCAYESARLLTQHKAEFAYGRIESRLLVPTGGDGLWPAFWSLGTDITSNPWPAAGEIDFMEYVSRLPNEIFGTLHGPGYNGGGSYSGIYDFGQRVDESYHTFAIEWEPNLITWYVDDILYHQATPSDLPGPWVFDKPYFLLLNFAIGGNFGGTPDPNNAYPQEFLVDYVRVYQGPDTAERFETSFVDDTPGWKQVSMPIADFSRSAEQPAGAPDDGLGLDEIWGYEFDLPAVESTFLIDDVRSTPVPPPSELVVTNLDDNGPGSLREALSLIADDGTITFDPGLAGGTVTLTSGQLTIDRSVTVDASTVAPLTISAGGTSRVVHVEAGTVVAMNDLVIRDGVAAPQGGGILNAGNLSLDRVTVTDNTENSGGPASFDLGGGGIYSGDGSVLNLTDSTVSNNTAVNQPAGGLYAFFNSTVNITRSTVTNNVGGDVAGGLRSLSDVTILNSTFSANTSTGWHGGGIFHTDGHLAVTNSTFAGNVAPGGTASGILVATFGAPASATLTNNVLEGHGGAFACAIEGGAAATITSDGSNVISDSSCNPNATTDQSNTDALLGALTDNGGPTMTHALGVGSPAIDAADAGACPATDQRGLPRPQGAGCDVGSVEQS